MLPFTVEQFFTVFADYNQSVWPVQWLLRAVAISILLLSIWAFEASSASTGSGRDPDLTTVYLRNASV
jgi:hypothetical protein